MHFRHAGWAPVRRRVLRIFERSGASRERIKRFRWCGSNAIVERSTESTGVYRVKCFHCHDRFCTPCAMERSRIIARNIRGKLSTGQHRFVTLTVRSSIEPLDRQLTLLLTWFRELRSTYFWKDAVSGGAFFIELTCNLHTQMWHPHLHVIVAGKYLDQKRLSAEWHRITNGSFVVDVRLIRDIESVARYVAKYATKSISPSVMHDDDKLAEAISALHSRRSCNTIGNWRGWRLLETSPCTAWEPVAPLWLLMEDAERGDPRAVQILNLIRPKYFQPRVTDDHDP